MKKLIITLIVVAIAVPSVSFAIQKFERTNKIETEENGSYSESQRDYKHKRVKQIDEKTQAGYYDGGYHNTPKHCTGKKEWQFVECREGGTKGPTTYKKVKEKETKKK